MPSSSPQQVMRERRVAAMLSEDQTFPAVEPLPKVQRPLPTALVAVIAVVSAIAVFSILFRRDGDLPHARIRAPLAVTAAPATEVTAPARPLTAALQTQPFDLRRSKRFHHIDSADIRVARLDSRRHWCTVVLRRANHTSRVRLQAGQEEPITSLGEPHLLLRIDAVQQGVVSGALAGPR